MLTPELLTTVVVAMFASTGFWTLVSNIYQDRRKPKETPERRALLGLLHENLMGKCNYYINQGWISVEDYEDLQHYIYEPYRDLGGNGTGERALSEVNKLPLHRKEFK